MPHTCEPLCCPDRETWSGFYAGKTDPAAHRIRSAAVILAPDQAFKEAAREALVAEPGKAHASV